LAADITSTVGSSLVELIAASPSLGGFKTTFRFNFNLLTLGGDAVPMPKETWITAGALTVALLLGLLVFSSYDKKVRLDQAQAELAESKAATAKKEGEIERLRDQLAAAQARARELEKEKEAVVQTHQNLEEEMRAGLESKDVTISQLQGKLTVNILDRILFDSGEADLKPDGAAVLRKVAGILQQHTNLQIHVIGHTDNVPIRQGARSRFGSNWELSTARATAAVRFLVEKAGVDPRRLGAVGYGEFRPVADNDSAEGRAKNRRIAITILSEEMAGSDAATVTPALSTQSAGRSAPAVPTNSVPQSIPDSPQAASEAGVVK
jgi:chemotaxis protein MotB